MSEERENVAAAAAEEEAPPRYGRRRRTPREGFEVNGERQEMTPEEVASATAGDGSIAHRESASTWIIGATDGRRWRATKEAIGWTVEELERAAARSDVDVAAGARVSAGTGDLDWTELETRLTTKLTVSRAELQRRCMRAVALSLGIIIEGEGGVLELVDEAADGVLDGAGELLGGLTR